MLMLRLGEYDESALIRAGVEALRRGEVIAFATETTYGLGCDPRNANAVERIFTMKGRDLTKPLLLVAADETQVEAVVDLDALSDPARQMFERLSFSFWPGPLTLVLPVRVSAELSPGVAPVGEVAVRMSSSDFVQALTTAFDFPIIATSANMAGEKECVSGLAVNKVFANRPSQPDLILDVGTLPRKNVSTVARILSTGDIEVIRQGEIDFSNSTADSSIGL